MVSRASLIDPISESLSSAALLSSSRSLSNCVCLLCETTLSLNSTFKDSLVQMSPLILFSSSTLMEVTLLSLISSSGICSILLLAERYFSLKLSMFLSRSWLSTYILLFSSEILWNSFDRLLILVSQSLFLAMKESTWPLLSSSNFSFSLHSSVSLSTSDSMFLRSPLLSQIEDSYLEILSFWDYRSSSTPLYSSIIASLSLRIRFKDSFSDFKISQDSLKAFNSMFLLAISRVGPYLECVS